MERLEAANMTLNIKKCKFLKSTVKFLGHLLSKQGVQADPDKTGAIHKMDVPQSVLEPTEILGYG